MHWKFVSKLDISLVEEDFYGFYILYSTLDRI